MKAQNEMKITLLSRSCNESFARVAVAAFIAQLDPTVDELNDIKTAVSEAVTNCIVHAYRDNLGPDISDGGHIRQWENPYQGARYRLWYRGYRPCDGAAVYHGGRGAGRFGICRHAELYGWRPGALDPG